MVKIKFKKSYIASRGYGYAGVEGAIQEHRMTDSLQELIDRGIVEIIKATPAATRKKATGKKGAETS